jgi:hypothetical protein
MANRGIHPKASMPPSSTTVPTTARTLFQRDGEQEGGRCAGACVSAAEGVRAAVLSHMGLRGV